MEKLIEKETIILQKINHPNIVKCMYIFNDEINFYFILEFVGGGDLSKAIEYKKINPGNKLLLQLLIAEMVLAFNYLHSNNIYHRDVKPENILIMKNVRNSF
jgi:serine/threonine protein kinase